MDPTHGRVSLFGLGVALREASRLICLVLVVGYRDRPCTRRLSV
ncbi:hypothetical protein [Rhodococcus sp. 114MFTsu3.1]|nr:hypothetical protein [Rhodococcus sp. 114MFTsu3.1]